MKCPKCHEHAASFWRWSLWPGPTRPCLNCGAKLRYVGFYLQIAAHIVFGGILGAAAFVYCLIVGVPIWVPSLGFAAVLGITAFLLPWKFGRYREIAD